MGRNVSLPDLGPKMQAFITSLQPVFNTLRGKEFGDAAGASLVIGQIAAVFNQLLDTGEHLAKYTGIDTAQIGAKFTTMLRDLSAVVILMGAIERDNAGDRSNALALALDMGVILGSIGTMLNAIKSIGDFTPVTDFMTRMTQFMTNAGEMVRQLVTFAGQWPDGVRGVEGLEALVGHVAALAGAIQAIGDWTPLKGFAAQATAFFVDAGEMVKQLVVFAGQWPTGVKAVVGLNELVAHVAALVAAVKAVGEYEAIKDFADSVSAMLADAAIMVRDLVEFAGKAPAGVDAAALIMTAVGQIVAPIKAVVDALKALGTYVSIGDAQAVIDAFAGDLLLVARTLQETAGKFNAVAMAAAAAVMVSVGQVMQPIKAAIDALKALDTYVGMKDAASSVAAFAADLLAVVTELRKTVADNLDAKAAAAAGEVMAAVQKILSPVKTAVDALKAIGAYVEIGRASCRERV